MSDDAAGYFIPPTVFDGVTRDMAIFREEIFGPVLAVSVVRDLDEALTWANDCVYGLSSSVFTNDLAAALRYGQLPWWEGDGLGVAAVGANQDPIR